MRGFFGLPLVAVALVPLGTVVAVLLSPVAAECARDGVIVAQAEQDAPDDGTADRPAGGDAPRRLQPQAYPTSVDPHRWDSPASRLAPLKADRDDDDSVADVSRDEAAALRREAAELRETLDRMSAQEKRGARVRSEDDDKIRKRAEDLEQQIGELQHRASDLDDEAADLRGDDDKALRTDLLHGGMTDETVSPNDVDPLGGDLDDSLDDDSEIE